jgi:tetratricopeptide (TPR) repeat protein
MKDLLKTFVYSFRQLRKTLAFLLGIAVAFSLRAQVSPTKEIARAANLNDEGRFSEANQKIGSLFAQGQLDDDALIGIACNIRGVALQNLGDWEGARRSYETAAAILRAKPDRIQQYASALDNLGSLKLDMGQLQEARSLRIRARQLYRSVNDHPGAARASVNLALVALALRGRKDARRFLADAIREESLVPKPDVGDLAALYDARALECFRDGQLNDALNEINYAIGLWTEHYGPHYYLLATGLSLRGLIKSALHTGDDARADFRLSLDILTMNNSADSKAYFIVERAYARVLRDSGQRGEADRLEIEAKEGLQGLSRRQCNGCSVSAESVR